jgi:hypothetical protein
LYGNGKYGNCCCTNKGSQDELTCAPIYAVHYYIQKDPKGIKGDLSEELPFEPVKENLDMKFILAIEIVKQ